MREARSAVRFAPGRPCIHASHPASPLMRTLAPLSLALFLCCTVSRPTVAQSPDETAVHQAALDYVEALYEVDSTRIARSVHPDLVKYGYYRRDGAYRGTPMTYDQLKTLAMNWNRDPQRVHPDSARKRVVVFEVLDKTASAKVDVHWGTDYMHLTKVEGRWMIQQILWQSPPPSK